MDLEKLSKCELLELVNNYKNLIEYLSRRTDRTSDNNNKIDNSSIIDNSYEAVTVASDGIIKFVNKAGEKIVGLSNEELIGKPFINYVYDDDKDMLLSNHQKRLTNHNASDLPSRYHFRLINKNKGIRWIEISAELIEWESKPAVISKMIDVTDLYKVQEQLRKNELKYRTIIENSLEAITVVRNFKLVFHNRCAVDLLKLKSTNIKNLDIRKFVHPLDLKRVEENHLKRLNNEEAEPIYTLRMVTKEKEMVWVEVKPILIDWEGSPAILSFMTDITHHMHTEKELRASQEKYKNLVENLQESVLITHQGKIQYFNNTFMEITGYAKYSLKNESILEIIYPDDRHKVIDKLDNNLYDFKLSKKPYEFRLLKKDKSVMWVRNRAILIQWEKSRAVFNFIDDISFEKNAQSEIKKLNTAIQQSEQAMIITDPEGNIEYANPHFTKLSGFSFEEIKGSTPRILKSGIYDDSFYKEIWDTIIAGKVWRGEILNRKKDQTLFWVLTSISPIKDDEGNIINFLSIQFDITRRKKIEENYKEAKEKAEMADRLKSEFLAQMSHEIRTPINVILSFSSLIQEEVNDLISEDLKEGFRSMTRAGQRIIRTIDLILNMSELQAGTYDYHPAKINLEEIMVGIVSERIESIEEKKLFLNFENEAENPDVLADQYTVEQIFSNLIDNAIKYTVNGGIKIKIVEKDSLVKVDVKDTGVGIKTEYMNDIFNPFTQEEQGYTRSFEGNGLGLALVKQFCELNKANIKVQSRKNTGSTFTVEFLKPNS